ncbi:MAG: M15 family metallopeptidase [Fimbriimonadaceae bacterium]|nr:M15 family metallopeptidase [Fimbriimonadaceae bacterium]
MRRFTDLVPLPSSGSLNTGVEPCPTDLILRRFGLPTRVLSAECADLRGLRREWASRMVTSDIGPFSATGHRMATDLLQRSLAEVRRAKPALYDVLGSAGMLCVRHVRGHPGLASNHSFGLAIDFTIDGQLDAPGDGQVQRGLLDLYSILKRFGWFWGAEFGREDAMHFEVGSRVVRDWIKRGLF